jgi:hypothetical protein
MRSVPAGRHDGKIDLKPSGRKRIEENPRRRVIRLFRLLASPNHRGAREKLPERA